MMINSNIDNMDWDSVLSPQTKLNKAEFLLTRSFFKITLFFRFIMPVGISGTFLALDKRRCFPQHSMSNPAPRTESSYFTISLVSGFFQNLVISLAIPIGLYGIEYQFPKSHPLTAAQIEKAGHWPVPCLVFSCLSWFTQVLPIFTDFRTSASRLSSWTKDQKPFRNCPVLHCQIRTAVGSSLIGYTATGLFTSPVRDSHFRTTPTADVSSLKDCRTLRFSVF